MNKLSDDELVTIASLLGADISSHSSQGWEWRARSADVTLVHDDPKLSGKGFQSARSQNILEGYDVESSGWYRTREEAAHRFLHVVGYYDQH
jgi:hypothetical protein